MRKWVRTLEGAFEGSLYGCFNFPISTYTPVGYGDDITPMGGIRYPAGLESPVGLVLINWTASFLFVEMQISGSAIRVMTPSD